GYGRLPGQLELAGVVGDLEPRELVRSGFARHGGERLQQNRARQRDRDARQDRARVVGRFSKDLARRLLRTRDRGGRKERGDRDDDWSNSHPSSYLKQKTDQNQSSIAGAGSGCKAAVSAKRN